jgi:hypothetical protein
VSLTGSVNGSFIVPLFTTYGVDVERIIQSKLWLRPNIAIEKKAWGIYALFECYSDTTLTFTIDTENGQVAVTQGTFAGSGSFTSPALVWSRSSADAAGMTIGFTMTSASADFAVISMVLVAQDISMRT